MGSVVKLQSQGEGLEWGDKVSVKEAVLATETKMPEDILVKMLNFLFDT